MTATVTSAGPGNHWYTVTFGEAWARVGHPAAGAPPPGHTGRYRVTALLESTHRVLLAPLEGPVNLDHPYG
ncbi:hypothetical protein [Kitasatospora sp. NPDC089509]|uniref:hypothetical protein n=1 Tax=Kitasatospora sp. NPDC089509 TaxID=3364079 RepID=UPI0037FF8881